MRGKKAVKRDIPGDPRFSRVDIAKLINYVMEQGKKSVARGIVYEAFDYISEKTKQDPLVVFDKAIENVGPSLEVRGKRVGGANYQIPFPVRAERRFNLACRWILEASRKKKGKKMAIKLAEELIAASQEQGDAFKKKLDVHKMADANKAFAHFAR